LSSKREFIDFLNDILDSITKIKKFTKGMSYDKFFSDDKTNYAVVRCFEIIGEAAKKIPPRIKNKNKSIPWQEMAAIRDKLIHGYFGVNLEVIWKTIQEDIPELESLLIQIMKKQKKG